MLEFRLLGTLEVRAGDGPLALGKGKQRALLAYLLLHRNRAVTREALIDAVWGTEPPASADHALDVYVSRLRKTLGPAEALLETHRGAFRLAVADEAVDVARFERLLAEARQSADAGSRLAASEAALALWRGPALADLQAEPFARPEGHRLEEERLVAEEERIEALLALGRHVEAIAPLQAMVAVEPLRERPRRQLMLALYRSGRHSEALEVYRDGRRVLQDELGLEPSRELRELEAAILRQDAELAPPATGGASDGPAGASAPDGEAPTVARRRRRALLVACGAVIVIAAATLAGVLATRGGSGGLRDLPPEAAGLVDASSGRIDLAVLTGSRPTAVVTGFSSAWVANEGADSVSRIDPTRAAVVQRIPVGTSPTALAVADGAVWVVNTGSGTVMRIDPATDTVTQPVRVGNSPVAIVSADGSLWVANGLDGTVSRVDPATGRVQATITVGGRPAGLAAAAGSVWVTDALSGQLVRIAPASNTTSGAVAVGAAPESVAAAAGSLWVANTGDGTLMRVDPRRTVVVQTVDLGDTPAALAATGDRLWVAEAGTGRVVEIDAKSGKTVGTVPVRSSPAALAESAGKLWVATLAPASAHRGGTLRIEGDGPLVDVDPAFILDPNDAMPSNDGLVAYDHSPGASTGLLVPDLAEALPRPTAGGTVYTFQLRPGLRYSSGQPVRPSDVRFTVERLYELRPHPSPYVTTNELSGIGFLQLNLVGEAACRRQPSTCDLSRGIVTDDKAGTVSFHLTAPDPNFLEKLTYPQFNLLPPTTTLHTDGTKPVAATGPYIVRSISKTGRVLVRNPFFRKWSAAAQPDGYPDRIVLRAPLSDARILRDVLAGRADVMEGTIPSNALASLATEQANQLHVDPQPLTGYLFLNTRVAPFDSVKARQAVALAVDRDITTRILRLWGGPDKPTCQILSPNFPAYVPYCPYTLHPNTSGAWDAPDVTNAQRLARASGTRGTPIILYMPSDRPFGRQLGGYFARLFDSLGWPTTIRYIKINSNGPNAYFPYVGDSRNHAQAGWGSWAPEYSTPASYIDELLGCDAYQPRSPNNANVTEFCDPTIQREIDHAKRLDAAEHGSASALWTRIEHQIIDRAPVVPLVIRQFATVVSARLGNYQSSATLPTIYDEYWVR